MRHFFMKVICFAASFVIALYVVSTIMNMGNTDMTEDMSSATFPLVTAVVEGQDVNMLHGYAGEMEESHLRDTLTPLPEDRKLYVHAQLFGAQIQGISYEVRSLDATRLIEQTDVYDYVINDDVLTADYKIKDLIDRGQEYILITILHLQNGQDASYYTRIVWQDGDMHVKDKLEYVQSFHDKTFNRSNAKSLAAYLESNEQGDNSNFAHVDIHSSLRQVTWGSLDILDVSDVQTQILEMDEDTASLRLDYSMQVGGESSVENYTVKEFFRIRYTKDRMYLLDYDRETKQYFDPESEVFANDKIILGITPNDVELEENSDGSVVVFEQAGALYSYKNGDDKLIRLFSFYDEDNMDLRTTYDQHQIDVLQVDEAGNVLFSVSGYMNRGRYEGQVGIAIYYFNTSINAIEEKAYVPYHRSFAHLQQNLSVLSYVNHRNEWYLYLSEALYRVRLDDGTFECVVDHVTRDRIVSSKSGEMVAWQDEDNKEEIRMMDLSTGHESQITDENGGWVTPVGFVGEDLVYGISDAGDLIKNSAGVDKLLMNTICIQSKAGKILKTYNQESLYITDAYVEGNTIQMSRVQKSRDTGSYYVVQDDQIMNNEVTQSTMNKITRVVTQEKEKIAEITLISVVKADSIRLQTPKQVVAEGLTQLALADDKNLSSRYYVYAGGGLSGIFNTPSEAVSNAAELSGVVVNEGQEYIWQKGSRKARTQITMIDPEASSADRRPLAACLDAILDYEGTPRNCEYLLSQGETATSILGKDIKGEVLDLTGCELSAVLYYVSHDTPVLAGVGTSGSVLIVGYDEKNTIIMDPNQGSIYKVGMNDSTEWFASCGNEFIAYVRED